MIHVAVPLAPGSRLGVYEVTGAIGEGGMGQVWRATDTRLGRQVAIKVLPESFASDPDRVARFEREAKTLASLNHPHIAGIYTIERSAGLHAIVMELVEGEDLVQRLRRGAIPLDDARRSHPGHGRLHEPGAGARARGGQARRHLGVRLRALRDAGGSRQPRSPHSIA